METELISEMPKVVTDPTSARGDGPLRRIFFIRGYGNGIVDPAAAGAMISMEYITEMGAMRPWVDDLEVHVVRLGDTTYDWSQHYEAFVDSMVFFYNIVPPEGAVEPLRTATSVSAFIERQHMPTYLDDIDGIITRTSKMTDHFASRPALDYMKRGLSWNFPKLTDDETFMGVPLHPALDEGNAMEMQCGHDGSIYKNQTLQELYEFVSNDDFDHDAALVLFREFGWMISNKLKYWVHEMPVSEESKVEEVADGEEPTPAASTARFIITQVADHTQITRVMQMLFFGARTGRFGTITPTTYFLLYVATRPGAGFWTLRCVSRNVADPWTVPTLAPHLAVESRIARLKDLSFIPDDVFDTEPASILLSQEEILTLMVALEFLCGPSSPPTVDPPEQFSPVVVPQSSE